MERTLDTHLDEIKLSLVECGSWVENSLSLAINALVDRKPDEFKKIHEIEKKINQSQIEIDKACFEILAKESPYARDLRMVLSVLKINSDLERMGDQVVNFSHTGKDYLMQSPLKEDQVLQNMSDLVRAMVKKSLDCFVKGDMEKAKEVLLQDDDVDALKNQIFVKMKDHIRKSPKDVDAALDLILMARNLERLGDHATNIAEDVIFVQTGQDIRHGGNSHGKKSG